MSTMCLPCAAFSCQPQVEQKVAQIFGARSWVSLSQQTFIPAFQGVKLSNFWVAEQPDHFEVRLSQDLNVFG
jgi:hypothetical protein